MAGGWNPPPNSAQLAIGDAGRRPMAPLAIISYDDTPNDQDALALGHLLADAGARLTLAYVRHTTEVEHTREERDQLAAEALLERGALWLEDCIGVEREVVVSAST